MRRRTALLAAVAALLPAGVRASPDSLATLKWRGDGVGDDVAVAPAVRASVDLHSNRLVRGVALFHRAGDDLLAQKAALVPEIRVRPSARSEVTASAALALIDREGTRAEVPHTDLAPEVRARHPVHLGDGLWLVPAAALLSSFQRDGSLRAEASATLGWALPSVDLELQLLHHHGLAFEPPTVALSYAHVQASRAFRLGGALLLPYFRALGEVRTLSPSDGPMWAAEAGTLVTWAVTGWPVRLLGALRSWYRGDLDETTFDVSFGVQAAFGQAE